jgi:hypothetical protein
VSKCLFAKSFVFSLLLFLVDDNCFVTCFLFLGGDVRKLIMKSLTGPGGQLKPNQGLLQWNEKWHFANRSFAASVPHQGGTAPQSISRPLKPTSMPLPIPPPTSIPGIPPLPLPLPLPLSLHLYNYPKRVASNRIIAVAAAKNVGHAMAMAMATTNVSVVSSVGAGIDARLISSSSETSSTSGVLSYPMLSVETAAHSSADLPTVESTAVGGEACSLDAAPFVKPLLGRRKRY